MTDIMIVLIVAAVVGAAARYVYKVKKNGAKCIGCAVGNGGCHCQGGCSGCSGCAGQE